MRKITKGNEPAELTKWIRDNPKGRYSDLTHEERNSIRQGCIEEQHGLCAYCCHAITQETAHNEHVAARETHPHRTLDYSNIVASCNRSKQCGKAHTHQALPLTSLMDECETELKFYLSGRVEGLSPRAITSIQVLNLGDRRENNRTLFSARKSILDTLLFDYGMEGNELEAEDGELMKMLLEDLRLPDAKNRLKPFAPVLVNVIRQLTN
ncbi:retron system putative HNH endonuclease [Pseudomonas fluorescens]|uniref:retron system putative HNH endonuclease n=1 Tax=Pseudomonas fluorescens TaxID=294 RepID=UPI00093624A5|nr:retron system putative HNH endonuclease [Pseudomonas fluorescens]